MRTLRLSVRDLQPGIPGARAGASENNVQARVHRSALSVFLGLQDRDDGTAVWNRKKPSEENGEPTDEEDAEDAGSKRPRETAARFPLRAHRRPGRRTRLRHLLGTPLRTTPRRRQLLERRRESTARRCARWKISPTAAARRTWCAKPTCAARSSKPSPSGIKPEQIVAVVGAFHAPVLGGELPAMTRRGTGEARAARVQNDADAVFVFQAVVAIRLRRRQSRPGVLRVALERLQRARAPIPVCHVIPVDRGARTPRAGHAPFHGRSDRRRSAGGNPGEHEKCPAPRCATCRMPP